MSLVGIFALHVILTVGLFTLLKLSGSKGLNVFKVVVVNYAVCVFTGIVFSFPDLFLITTFPPAVYVHAVILGLSFIACFNLIGYVANNVSVTLSTLSSKLSFVLPVIASVLVWSKETEYTIFDILGVLTSLVAIFLASYRPNSKEVSKGIWLVFILFFSTGFVDGFINYSNYRFGSIEGFDKLFPILSFSTAFICGASYLLFTQKKFQFSSKELGFGTILGTVNYFSIFTMILVLAGFDNNGALAFPIINVSVILIAAVVAYILFKERLSKLNLVGLGIAICSLMFLLVGSL